MEVSKEGLLGLKQIRALRRLPETGGTLRAEVKILKQLNAVDTLYIAMELAADEEQALGESEAQ